MYAIAVLNNSYGKAKHRNIKTMGILEEMTYLHELLSSIQISVCVCMFQVCYYLKA